MFLVPTALAEADPHQAVSGYPSELTGTPCQTLTVSSAHYEEDPADLHQIHCA